MVITVSLPRHVSLLCRESKVMLQDLIKPSGGHRGNVPPTLKTNHHHDCHGLQYQLVPKKLSLIPSDFPPCIACLRDNNAPTISTEQRTNRLAVERRVASLETQEEFLLFDWNCARISGSFATQEWHFPKIRPLPSDARGIGDPANSIH
jgi:hypothetical protein